MSEAERRQPRHVFRFYFVSLGTELIQRRLHIDRIPQHQQVDDQTERTELIFLPFAVTLAQLTPAAVKDFSGQSMASFAAVKLGQDPAAVGLIVDQSQQVECLGDAAQVRNGLG